MKTIERRTLSALVASLAFGLVGVVASGADVTIADVAPRDSMLVVGVDDFASMQAAFERTGLAAMMKEPSVRTWLEDATEEAMERFAEMLDSIDAEMGDLAMPTGPAGMAMWPVEREDATEPPFGMLMVGDWGEGAAQMHQTLVSAMEKGEERGELVLRIASLDDLEIYSVERVEGADEPDDGDDEMDEWDDWGEPSAQPEFKTMHYTRLGDRLVASTERETLETVIDRFGGAKGESIGESEDFHAGLSQVGAHDGYAVFLPGPMLAAAEKAAEKADGMGGGMMPMLGALGLSDVRAMSMGVKLDADDGMMESKYGVLVPQMRGLLSLLDSPATSFEPPAFVSADVASYGMFQVRLGDLMNVLQGIVAELPAEQAMQAGAVLPMIQGQLGPILSNLGSEIYVAQSYSRPFGADSKQTTTAIGVRDADMLSQAITQAGSMIGLASRDFQGNQVWSMPQGGGMMPGMDLAFGVGFGHMFIGTTESVENALRLGGAGDELSLSKDARFKRAMRVAKPKGSMFSYMNLPRTLEYSQWYFDNFEKIQAEMMEQMMGDVDDPQLREMMAANQPEKPAWMEGMPDLSVIAKHVGDSVTEFHRTDDGMRGRTVWMRPE